MADMYAKQKRVFATVVACAGVAVTAIVAARKKQKRNRQPTFHRNALHHPLCSTHTTAWRQILSCGSSSDFLVSINVDRHVFFDKLLPVFETERQKYKFGSPYWNGPKKTGRSCSINTEDILGLVLWCLKSSARRRQLCPIFGLVPTSVNVWFDYGLTVLYRTLKVMHDARITWPTVEEMKESTQLLQENREFGHLLKGVFAVVDGGRMPCADYNDPDLQNAYYEGYTCSVEVTNLFVFNFMGELIHAAINYPASWHDDKLAYASGVLYPKLEDEMTPPGFSIFGDSAFVTRTMEGKLVRSRKTNETSDIPKDAVLAAVDIIMQRVMPSERQSAEWGIRSLKGPFGILRLPLPSFSRKRYKLLCTCARLLNLRTRLVGLNQIRTVYANGTTDTQPWVQRIAEEHEQVAMFQENE